jgi:hypothetical protein
LGVVTLDVATVTCLGIGEYVGVIGARGDPGEIFVARDLSDAAMVVTT